MERTRQKPKIATTFLIKTPATRIPKQKNVYSYLFIIKLAEFFHNEIGKKYFFLAK